MRRGLHETQFTPLPFPIANLTLKEIANSKRIVKKIKFISTNVIRRVEQEVLADI